MIFVDTPGIHKRPPHRINKIMISEAVAAIPDADVMLLVVDVSAPPRDEDEHIARLLSEKAEKIPVIFVFNKMDQHRSTSVEAVATRMAAIGHCCPITPSRSR